MVADQQSNLKSNHHQRKRLFQLILVTNLVSQRTLSSNQRGNKKSKSNSTPIMKKFLMNNTMIKLKTVATSATIQKKVLMKMS